MSNFERTMVELGYNFDEQEGKKLTYRKRMSFSELALVIDLELNTINPVSVPVSIFLYEHDFVEFYKEFERVRADAKEISKRSGGKLKVLN